MAEIRPFPQRIDLGKPKKPFGFYPSQILEHPGPPQWLVDGMIMRGTLTIVAGEKAVGKSLFIQQMLSSAALGMPFLGRHTEPIKSFAYFCEDAQPRLEARQFDICEHLGVMPSALGDLFSWEERATEECLLVKFPRYGNEPEYTADWFRLWDYVKCEGAQLVALDTARCIFGGNENAPAQVTPFVRALQAKALEIDGAIILNAHPAKGGQGPAGTGAWHNSARAGFNFVRPPDYDPIADTPKYERIIYDIGSNYSGRSRQAFKWEKGVFVADEPDPVPARADTLGRREVMDREMLYGLIRSRNNGGRVPADWDRQGSMQRRYRATFDRRTAWNDLNASFERLLASRQIVRVRVDGECLVRPADGVPYEGEEKWTV